MLNHDEAASSFSPNYAEARDRFRAASADAGFALRSYPNSQFGPNNETLACDVAWGGPLSSSKVIVLIAGTHGVEGFCGSAAMVDWLSTRPAGALPAGTAALLVHALNPHGFAWLRRVTEEGVDLNRNCIDFTQSLPENTVYDELADAIAPSAMSGPVFAAAEAKIAAFVQAHGELAYRAAFAGGQYNHPHGLFYGGNKPVWSRQTLESIIADFALVDRDRTAIIDYHTGLGASGHGEIISGHRPGTTGFERAHRWHGTELANPFAGKSVSTVNAGLIEESWIRCLGDSAVFVTLEFGTFNVARIMRALREDQWLHTHGIVDWSESETRRIKAAIREAFNPDSTQWRARVLSRSRVVIARTLSGLSS